MDILFVRYEWYGVVLPCKLTNEETKNKQQIILYDEHTTDVFLWVFFLPKLLYLE